MHVSSNNRAKWRIAAATCQIVIGCTHVQSSPPLVYIIPIGERELVCYQFVKPQLVVAQAVTDCECESPNEIFVMPVHASPSAQLLKVHFHL